MDQGICHLLDPTDGVETPRLQIGSDRFLDPSNGASAVFLTPDTDVFRIAQTGGIDVVQAHREEWLPVRRNQPPMILALAEGEEPIGLGLGRPRIGRCVCTIPRPRGKGSGERAL